MIAVAQPRYELTSLISGLAESRYDLLSLCSPENTKELCEEFYSKPFITGRNRTRYLLNTN
jgi:hypothetical protein